jgi:riboflavin kinase/FMN adenylyltransferase
MKIFQNLDNLPDFQNAVITIGSFDGVHPGHKHIIGQMKSFAEEIKGETVLVTFFPHPRIALSLQLGEKSSMRLLCDLDEKAALLNKYGIDNLVVVPFTREFSEQNPDDYIEDFLVKNFHPKIIVIGYDHKFGKGRAGDIEFLRKFQNQFDYKIIEISKQEVDGIAVSSTKIRNALEAGNVELAAKLLGYAYALKGRVVDGKKIGRTLGFPTANIKVDDEYKLIPADGIYAVIVQIDSERKKGMLYIGSSPTISENREKTVEVHIFDFDKDVYGLKINILFINFIRFDQKFENLAELSLQLERDKITALEKLQTLNYFEI